MDYNQQMLYSIKQYRVILALFAAAIGSVGGQMPNYYINGDIAPGKKGRIFPADTVNP